MKISNECQELFGKSILDLSANRLFREFSGGNKPEKIDNEYYVENKKAKMDLIFDKNQKLISIIMQSDKQFSLEFVFGEHFSNVDFLSSKKDVNKFFGDPTSTGEAEEMPIFGVSAPWDKYKAGDLFIKFEYTLNLKKVQCVAIHTSEVEQSLT